MKILIAYYSRSGHNKQLAGELSQMIKADVEEIVDQKPKGFIMSGWQSMNKHKTKIKPSGKDPANYDLLVLVSPLWFGGIPPATRTYVEAHIPRIKSLAFLSVSGNGVTNEHYVDAMAKKYSLKAAPRLLISDTQLLKKTYHKQLSEFAEKLPRLEGGGKSDKQ